MAELDSYHPLYGVKLEEWKKMRDTVAGSDTVKAKREAYLPPTTSMIYDGALRNSEPGKSAYDNYVLRAIFPDLTGTAVRTFVGLLNKDETVIELPAKLEPMRELATADGETLSQLLRRIHESQLTTGRIGLLADVANGATTPHLVSYQAENVINWDVQQGEQFGLDYLQFAIVTDTGYERVPGSFDWTNYTQYRFLGLDEAGRYYTYTEDSEGNQTNVVYPSILGRTSEIVPFTFVNARDLSADPGDVPLLGVADSSIAIYRGEADMRQTLHMLGQSTLVVSGITPGSDLDSEEPLRIGDGARIDLPEGGTAQFIGVEDSGLTEQRLTLQDDYKRAAAEGARLLENNTSQAESAEALKARIGAKTTTLMYVAKTSAAGLERALRQCAVWVGADPDQVKVIPNTDFVEDGVRGQDVAQLMAAKQAGAPISLESIHAWMAKNEFTDLDFEAERAKLEDEQELLESLRPAPPVQLTTEAGDSSAEEEDDDSEVIED